MAGRKGLDYIEQNEGIIARRAMSNLERVARAAVADPLTLGDVTAVLDRWDVSYRDEDRGRLQSTIVELVRRHFRSLVTVEPLAKGSGVRCKLGVWSICSRQARSLVNGLGACWQHEEDAVIRAGDELRKAAGAGEALGDPIKGYRADKMTVAEKWATLNSDLAYIRSLPLNDEIRSALDSTVAAFSAKWEGLDNG
jgi:hypothetical protein